MQSGGQVSAITLLAVGTTTALRAGEKRFMAQKPIPESG